MPMNRSQKTAYIGEVSEIAKNSLSIIAICYTGLNSMQMYKIRTQASEMNVFVKVSKNTLTRLALADSGYSSIAGDMKGHVLLLFATKEPGSAARLAQSLIKQYDFIKVCSIGLTGDKLSVSQLEQVAALPSYDEAIGMLMATMIAPVRALATVMQETYAGLARAVSQIADQKSKH